MKPARASAAVVTAVFTAAVGWLLLDLWSGQGGRTPPQSFVAAVAILVVAAVVLVLGWEVRRSVRGERKPPMNPLARGPRRGALEGRRVRGRGPDRVVRRDRAVAAATTPRASAGNAC